MRTGDSRALDGPGIIPAQDHRKGIDPDVRALQICARIMDRDKDGRDREDEAIHGDRQGISVWEQEGDRRPMAAWREVRLCVVVGFDGYTGSGAGDGGDEPGAAFTGGYAGGGYDTGDGSGGGGGGGGNNLAVGSNQREHPVTQNLSSFVGQSQVSSTPKTYSGNTPWGLLNG